MASISDSNFVIIVMRMYLFYCKNNAHLGHFMFFSYNKKQTKKHPLTVILLTDCQNKSLLCHVFEFACIFSRFSILIVGLI